MDSPSQGPAVETRPRPLRQRDSGFLYLLLCFFLSGFAGLVYETAWTRQFAFVFGTSSLAVATVLAAYMGGLAVGAAVAARLAHRVRRPVLVYGLLELGIGVVALAIPLAIDAARWLYVALYGGQDSLPGDGGLTTALFYLACSFVILMLPTAMMGATLPLLTRYAVRSDADVSRRTGLLYAINAAGAVAGVLVAAFVLLPELGLWRTIQVAALINGLVFLAAWALSRSASMQRESPTRPPDAAVKGAARSRLILLLILGSGVASFTYEVVWVRLLGHVLGGSVYAFATMLASFLLGIALGSAIASRFATTRRRASLGFALAQLAIAATSLGAYGFANFIPGLNVAWSSPGSAVSGGGVLVAMLVLFPAATFVGATFPLAVRLFARSEAEAGRAAASVYAANTLGSIIGAVGAGFFIVPWLGYSGTFAACAGLNLALAGLAAVGLQPRRPTLALVASALMMLVVAVPLPTPWAVLQNTSFRWLIGSQSKVEYYAVGRSATVLMLAQPPRWMLRSNGLPEASIDRPLVSHRRSILARWLGFSAVLARPSARSMLVVGLGGGVALEVVPPSIERIDVIELEKQILEANRKVADRRWRDPLSDPRVHVQINDARNALLLTDRRFDAIVSQPSHPWSGGAAHLYTREFFELAKSRLTSDGIFVQWIGLAFVDEPLLRSLLATLRSVYEYVQVFRPGSSAGLLFLSSDAPINVEQTAALVLADAESELSLLGLWVWEDVRLALILDDVDTRELALGARLIRDDHNQLQTESPRLGKRRLNAAGGSFLATVGEHADGSWPQQGIFYALQRTTGPRARRLADGLKDATDRAVADAFIEMRAGRVRSGREKLDELLSAAPRHKEARSARLLLAKTQVEQGVDPETIVEGPLSEIEKTLTAGWRAIGEGKIARVRDLESALAAVPIRSLLWPEASRLRVRWRIRSGSPPRAREAMEIVESQLLSLAEPSDSLLLAMSAVVADEPVATIDALEGLSRSMRGARARSSNLAQSGLQLLRALPRDPDLDAWRSEVEQNLRARLR